MPHISGNPTGWIAENASRFYSGDDYASLVPALSRGKTGQDSAGVHEYG
jgi:hypothetical protein